MEAVIKTGGKQYRVAKGSQLKVEKLDVEPGKSVDLNEVIMTVDKGTVTLGKPTVEGASVKATVVEHIRGPKIIVFKKKRRKGYIRKQGHRQNLSVIQIESIKG